MKLAAFFAVLAAILSVAVSAETVQVPGVVPGVHSVDNYGAFNYSIPIDVPPGINGVQPALSVNYNSNAGEGVVGLGWSLGGLSQISRGGGIYARQGYLSGVNFDANDHFYLDGQLLLLISSGYSASEDEYFIEYRTEIETFARVFAYVSAANAGSDVLEKLKSNPDYFVVHTKGGMIQYYGRDAAAGADQKAKQLVDRGTASWMISSIEDLWGNELRYYYEKDAFGQEILLLDRVDYAFSPETDAPLFGVKLVYEERVDPLPSGLWGKSMVLGSLLDAISVRKYTSVNQFTELSSYDLQYERKPSAEAFDLLSSVSNIRDGKTLEPILIDYTYENQSLPREDGSFGRYGGRFLPVADSRGSFLLHFKLVENEVRIQSKASDSEAVLVEDSTFNSDVEKSAAILAGDINADGLADIYYYNYQSGVRFVSNGVLANNRLGWDDGRAVSVASTSVTALVIPVDVALLDVDGDGASELIELLGWRVGALWYYKVQVSKFIEGVSGGFALKQQFLLECGTDLDSPKSNYRFASRMIFADADHDGLADIFIQTRNNYGPWALYPILINRLVPEAPESGSESRFELSTNFGNSLKTGLIPVDPDFSQTLVGDWNQDGNIDLVFAEPREGLIKLKIFSWITEQWQVLKEEDIAAEGLDSSNLHTFSLMWPSSMRGEELLLAWLKNVNVRTGFQVEGHNIRFENWIASYDWVKILNPEDRCPPMEGPVVEPICEEARCTSRSFTAEQYASKYKAVVYKTDDNVEASRTELICLKVSDAGGGGLYIGNQKQVWHTARGEALIKPFMIEDGVLYTPTRSIVSFWQNIVVRLKFEYFLECGEVEGAYVFDDFIVNSVHPDYQYGKTLRLYPTGDALPRVSKIGAESAGRLQVEMSKKSDGYYTSSNKNVWLGDLFVVDRLSARVGKKGSTEFTNSETYTYFKPTYNLEGRGFLGFGGIEVKDSVSDTSLYTEYYTNWPFHGVVKKQERFRELGDGEATLLSQVTNTATLDTLSTLDGLLFPMLPQTVEKQWEYDGVSDLPLEGGVRSLEGGFNWLTETLDNPVSSTTTLRWYDAQAAVSDVDTALPPLSYDVDDLPGNITHGNLTRTIVKNSGGSYTRSDFEYLGNGVSVRLGRPGRVTTKAAESAADADNAQKRIKGFSYRADNGALLGVVDHDGTAEELLTTIKYTPQGHPYEVIVNGAFGEATYDGAGRPTEFGSQTTKVVSATYSSATGWRFPDRVENALWTSGSQTYDDWGRVLKATDANGLVTEFLYDAFGRLEKVTGPDDRIAETKRELVGSSTNLSFDLTSLPENIKAAALDNAAYYKVTSTATGAPTSVSYQDVFGRAIRTEVEKADGSGWVYQDSVYDKQGLGLASTQAYLSSDPLRWSYLERDPLKRVSTTTAINGRVDTYHYSGLTVGVFSGTETPATARGTVLRDSVDGLTREIWNGVSGDFSTFLTNLQAGTTTAAMSSVRQEYSAWGELDQVTAGSEAVNKVITSAYNAIGKQESLSDPDAGFREYRYDALGRLRWEASPGQNYTRYEYDVLGRRTEMISYRPEGTKWSYWADFYFYDGERMGSKGALAREVHAERINSEDVLRRSNFLEGEVRRQRGFYYDHLSRPFLRVQSTYGTQNGSMLWYYEYSTFDDQSRLSSVSYFWRPQGLEYDMESDPYSWRSYRLNYFYNDHSYLTKIEDAIGRRWWECTSFDKYGRALTVEHGFGASATTTSRTYDPVDGTLSQIVTGSFQNSIYDFDRFGNLTSRTDNGVTETFGYDRLDRLTYIDGAKRADYDAMGRIKWKDEVAHTYTYGASQPNAVTDAYGYTIGYDGRGLMVSRSKDGEAWSFGWAPCEKPWWIFKGEMGHEYGYTASGAKYRHVQVNGQTNGQWNRTKATFFLGDLEQDWENANGTWSVAETRLTISGPGGAIGVCTIAGDHVQGQPKRQWYHKDHLGSVAFVTDEAGSVSRYSYDAWGHRRDPQTRERTSIGYTPLAGYTGHDMLDNLGIVHMGGRLYDPLLGRTLSPDPFIPNPSFSESYNRYSYVENRPLSATDPTGYAVNMHISSGYGVSGGYSNGGWITSPDLGVGKDYSGMFGPGPGRWNPGTITYVPGYNSPPFDFTSTGTGTVSPVKSTSATVSAPKPTVVNQRSNGPSTLDHARASLDGLNRFGNRLEGNIVDSLTGTLNYIGDVGKAGQLINTDPEYVARVVLRPVSDAFVGLYESGKLLIKDPVGEWNRTVDFMLSPEGMADAVFMVDSALLGRAASAPVGRSLPGTPVIGLIDEAVGDLQQKSLAPALYYPINNGFLFPPTKTYLYPGKLIDRYGGSGYSRFFAPVGTPASARALPPGAADQPLRTFRVLKPLEVDSGIIAPAFGQPGLGQQYVTPVPLEVLIKRGIIEEIE